MNKEEREERKSKFEDRLFKKYGYNNITCLFVSDYYQNLETIEENIKNFLRFYNEL